MSQAAQSQPPAHHRGVSLTSILTRGLVVAAIAVLLTVTVNLGRRLWDEWSVLRVERDRARLGAVIGYQGINPKYSWAMKPAGWIHDEGDATLLWSGWKQGAGHQWFRVGRGEVSPDLMSSPLGRDVIQAIDEPIIEQGGGTRWQLIPDEAFVYGHRLGGVDTAYPMLVLSKVFVVNDTIADTPYLIASNPFLPREEQVAVYETVVEGRRVTMGLTGYFYNNTPLLYDRGTESFWVGESDALRAIAGAHKGRRLRRIARPLPVAWGDWRWAHPDSRLVVGANRTGTLPEL